MKKTEAVTPREVLDQLLRAAGDDLVLVGGQALAFWVHRYGLVLPGDVVFRVIGLTQEAVRKRAVRVEFDGTTFVVMHPLDVLRSRLANLHQLVEKQNPKGIMQLALAIDVVRQFLRGEAGVMPRQASSARSPLQPFVSEIERLALEDAGRKVAKRFGLHVADAIDPSLIPAGAFWQRKWPELSPLMSPPYAARFSPPRA